jgi:hypothetical protein
MKIKRILIKVTELKNGGRNKIKHFNEYFKQEFIPPIIQNRQEEILMRVSTPKEMKLMKVNCALQNDKKDLKRKG